MIDAPEVVRTEAQRVAILRLVIPKAEIREPMGRGIEEVLGVVTAQPISHDLRGLLAFLTSTAAEAAAAVEGDRAILG